MTRRAWRRREWWHQEQPLGVVLMLVGAAMIVNALARMALASVL